jgi:hypothetical protein
LYRKKAQAPAGVADKPDVNPIINRPIARALLAKEQWPEKPSKSGMSNFDKIRAMLKERPKRNLRCRPRSNASRRSKPQVLQSDLRRRLERSGARSAPDLFRVEMAKNRSLLDNISRRVNGRPSCGVQLQIASDAGATACMLGGNYAAMPKIVWMN